MAQNVRHQLGSFLRERRKEQSLQPTASVTGRRTPGLRREEVAARAFISTEYYTRIEQGRFLPSMEVLRQIADALNLTADQRQYLLDLAESERSPAAGRKLHSHPDSQELDPGLSRLLTAMSDVPALAIGEYTRILAWNDAAAALFLDFAAVPDDERDCAHLIFTNDTFRSRFRDPAGMQDVIVAILRAGTATWRPDPEREQIVHDLQARSDEFAARWSNHTVQQPHDSTPIELQHPQLGVIPADRVVLRNMDSPEARLLFFVYRPTNEGRTS